MSPTLELWGAIAARLKAYSALTALIGSNNVHDRVPGTATLPYVRRGPADELQIDAECVNAVEVTFQIDAFSQAVGFVEVARIAAAVRDALHRHSLTLTTKGLVEIEHRQTRYFDDPDPLTSHAAIEFVATVEVN